MQRSYLRSRDCYLSREERYELARLLESGLSMRGCAARMGRSPSTISRELSRNAAPRTGGCQPGRAVLPESAEAGERYFLGNDLLVYKVDESVNPFAGQNPLGTFEEYGP